MVWLNNPVFLFLCPLLMRWRPNRQYNASLKFSKHFHFKRKRVIPPKYELGTYISSQILQNSEDFPRMSNSGKCGVGSRSACLY